MEQKELIKKVKEMLKLKCGDEQIIAELVKEGCSEQEVRNVLTVEKTLGKFGGPKIAIIIGIVLVVVGIVGVYLAVFGWH
jgi:hypothetical protein